MAKRKKQQEVLKVDDIPDECYVITLVHYDTFDGPSKLLADGDSVTYAYLNSRLRYIFINGKIHRDCKKQYKAI